MVYDGFMVYNELDTLWLRLSYLDPVVDKFIIVESNQTHRGRPKEMYFENAKRFPAFAKFLPKVVHVVVDMPEGLTPHGRDQHQREMIAEGLPEKLDADDFIMIGDLDEIPRRELVAERREGTYMMSLFLFMMNTRYNRSISEGGFTFYEGGAATIGLNGNNWNELCGGHPQVARTLSITGWNPIQDAGWHFSYQGGPELVRNKLANYAHDEFDNEGSFSSLMRWKENARNRSDPRIEVWSPDDPRYGSLREFLTPAMVKEYFVK